MGNEPFTGLEFTFLEQATTRALMNKQSSELYWHARYLYELALQTNDKDQRNFKLEQAKSALAQVWKRTSCDDKRHDLMNSRFSHVDFLSALVILEDLLLDQSKSEYAA